MSEQIDYLKRQWVKYDIALSQLEARMSYLADNPNTEKDLGSLSVDFSGFCKEDLSNETMMITYERDKDLFFKFLNDYKSLIIELYEEAKIGYIKALEKQVEENKLMIKELK